MLTQTIINPPFFYSFRETHTELIPRYCSVYPGVPCTIQLPNTRLHFFLAELAVAACHVLSVPRTAQAPAESVALHPASCILHLASYILHPASSSGPWHGGSGRANSQSSAPAAGHSTELPVQEFLAALVQK